MKSRHHTTIEAEQLPELGEPLGGGVFANRYWLGDTEYALIDMGRQNEIIGTWGEAGYIEGANSFGDGYQNTLFMVGSRSESALTALCKNCFIPSPLEQAILTSSISLGIIDNDFKEAWYWSSRRLQDIAAYFIGYRQGLISGGPREMPIPTRLVQRLAITRQTQGIETSTLPGSVPSEKSIKSEELPRLGQELFEGTFAARYWLDGKEYALIDIGPEAEISGKWGEDGNEDAKSYTDGYSNTRAMLKSGSEIAKQALFNEAFIPAPLEQILLIFAKTEGIIRNEFQPGLYWSSQSWSYRSAASCNFSEDITSGGGRDIEQPVRLVRKVLISP